MLPPAALFAGKTLVQTSGPLWPSSMPNGTRPMQLCVTPCDSTDLMDCSASARVPLLLRCSWRRCSQHSGKGGIWMSQCLASALW